MSLSMTILSSSSSSYTSLSLHASQCHLFVIVDVNMCTDFRWWHNRLIGRVVKYDVLNSWKVYRIRLIWLPWDLSPPTLLSFSIIFVLQFPANPSGNLTDFKNTSEFFPLIYVFKTYITWGFTRRIPCLVICSSERTLRSSNSHYVFSRSLDFSKNTQQCIENIIAHNFFHCACHLYNVSTNVIDLVVSPICFS